MFIIRSYWKETSTTIETPVLVPAGGIVVLHEFGWHCSPLHPCLGGIVVLRPKLKAPSSNPVILLTQRHLYNIQERDNSKGMYFRTISNFVKITMLAQVNGTGRVATTGDKIPHRRDNKRHLRGLCQPVFPGGQPKLGDKSCQDRRARW